MTIALAVTVLDILQPLRRVGEMKRTLARRFAVNPFPFDDLEDFRRTRTERINELEARRLPHRLDHLVGRQPETGIDQTDIAPRAAMPDRFRFQHDDRGAFAGGMKCRGITREAATNHEKIDIEIRRQRRSGNCLRSTMVPEIGGVSGIHGKARPG